MAAINITDSKTFSFLFDNRKVDCKVAIGDFNTEPMVMYEFTCASDPNDPCSPPPLIRLYDTANVLCTSDTKRAFDSVDENGVFEVFLAWVQYHRTLRNMEMESKDCTTFDLRWTANGASRSLQDCVEHLDSVLRSFSS